MDLYDDDIPQFLVHLDHRSAMFRMEVFAASGTQWHRAYDERYLPRNSAGASFSTFPFDGSTMGGNKLSNVPEGTSLVKITVLKGPG